MINRVVYGAVIVLASLLIFGSARGEYITAPIHDAGWQNRQGKTLCGMLQPIERFGSVGFLHRSGEPLQFFLQDTRFQSPITRASLFVDSSPWRDNPVYRQDYTVFLEKAAFPAGHRLVVYAQSAEEMLAALLQGHYPVFSYLRRDRETRVAVSAVRFAESYAAFDDCRKKLMPFGEWQLERDNLYFPLESKALTAPVMRRLRKVAAYLREIDGSRVVIVSATAAVDGADRSWFAGRAARIAKQLRNYGVDSGRIRVVNGSYAGGRGNEVVLRVFGADSLRSYYFGKGSMRLGSRDKQRLDLLARYVGDNYPAGRIIVGSHTDSKGAPADNLAVSRRRGEVVKAFLAERGIAADRISVKAYGESRPVKSNRFAEGRAQNRRVVVSIFN